MTFLYLNRSGELISRITNDINRIHYFVANMLPDLFRESLTVVALISYIIYLTQERGVCKIINLFLLRSLLAALLGVPFPQS